VFPAVYALLPDKRENTYSALFASLKKWCPTWSPGVIKMNFEAGAIKALKTLCKTTGGQIIYTSVWPL